MSRVEQALRRAGQVTMAPPAEDGIEQPGRSAEQVSLELYPRELTYPTERHPPVEVAPVPVAGTDAMQLARAGELAACDIPLQLSAAYRHKVVTNPEVSFAPVEQYRRLAAALHHLQNEQGLRSVTVTSAVPQEGKTLTIVNLALTLSESYTRRVLLIDADLRRPSIHEAFGLGNSRGLCDSLRSTSGKVAFTRASSRLWVLPAGALEGDPMTALASPRMVDLLEEAAAEFDWVLLDAPPVTLMADAALLVRLTRAVVLVIGAGSTPYKVVERAVADLGREHIVGTVLNRIEDGPSKVSPYYARP